MAATSASVKETKYIRALNAVAAGLTTQTATFDALGFDQATAICLIGGTFATSVTLKIQRGDAANGSDAADPAAGAISAVGSAINQALGVTMEKPTHRFITVSVARGGSSSLDGVILVLSKGSHEPITQDATMAATGYGADS